MLVAIEFEFTLPTYRMWPKKEFKYWFFSCRHRCPENWSWIYHEFSIRVLGLAIGLHIEWHK